MKIKNGILYEKNGWKYISVKGDPKERGYAFGYFSATDYKKAKEMMDFNIYQTTGKKWEYFIDACTKHFVPTIKEKFAELYEEMEGIAEGCTAGGTPVDVNEIIAWNNYYTLTGSWFPNSRDRGDSQEIVIVDKAGASDKCSAFIAVGDYTKDGKIVVAHNSFNNFIEGQFQNYILDLHPTKGHRFIMQTCPCWIWSGTDFFVNSKGIIGTETTIGGFVPFENNYTVACRIRKVMQYATTLDECNEFLLDGNSGDYANSWLFGDINTNEIMRLELGLKYHNIERTKNGCFIGFNAPYDPRIRNLECVNSGFDDIRRHQGARRVRLADLMEENKGNISVEMAMKIIADHHDVYLDKENPCSRTVCSHYNLDPREYMSQADRPKPFEPKGAVDGTATDSTLASKMSFMARFGSSCGTPMIVEDFCDKHRQWAYLKPYLRDFPSEEWTKFTTTHHHHPHSQGKTKTIKNTKIHTSTETLGGKRIKKNKTRRNKILLQLGF